MKMSIVLHDSDCLIEEQNISCITLDDSHDEQSDDGQILPQVLAEEGDIEDGELDEEQDGTYENICEIRFADNANFQKYGEIISNALKEKLIDEETDKTIEIVGQENESGTTLCVKWLVNNAGAVDLSDSAKAREDDSQTVSDKFDKEQSPDLTGISELFTIDITPTAKSSKVIVPSYKRAIKDALLDEEAAAHKKQKQEEKNMKVTKASNCFNCGESGHSLKDCPMPFNAKRIKNAKKAFTRVDRYHAEIDQKFAHLKPGTISDNLRVALELRKGEIPFYFYRMRLLGYPPGWLEDAKVEHSGINLFNSDGSKILHSDEDDGDADSNVNHKYNAAKIIDYPGFNQYPGDDFFDDFKYHRVPPFSTNQSKEEFVKTLGDSVLKIYKRKKLKDFPIANADDSVVNDSIHIEVADMEIEDPDTTAPCNIEFERPPPPPILPHQDDEETPPPPPMLSPSPTCETNAEKEATKSLGSPQSPSLAELERKKNLLLHELEDKNLSVADSLVDEILELDNSTQDEAENILTDNNSMTDNQIANTTQASSENSKDSCKSSENHADLIEKSYMGTPVLQFSPYDCLPNGANFKVGVSDVINFENLPDSTGKYENMKELIKKVRTIIHKLHSDE